MTLFSKMPTAPEGLTGLRQRQLDWLRRSGVETETMIWSRSNWLSAIQLAYGETAPDGRFDVTEDGPAWLAFDVFDGFMEKYRHAFWQPRSGEMATWSGRAFALGQEVIDDSATFSFDCNLNVFGDPLEWLKAKRDGIVVLDWTVAFERLRDCPRIAVSEGVLAEYRKHMKPPHMPQTFVIAERKAA